MKLTGSAARACAIAVAFVLPLSLATPAVAGLLNVTARSTLLGPGGEFIIDLVNRDSTTGLIPGQTVESLISRAGDNSSFIQAQAKSDYGTLGVSARSTMVNTIPFLPNTDPTTTRTRQALASASSSWTDTFTLVNGNAAVGTPVRLLTTMVVDISELSSFGDGSNALFYGMLRFFTSNQPGAGWCAISAGGVGADSVEQGACSGLDALHVGRNLISFETEMTVGEHTWAAHLDAESQVVSEDWLNRAEGTGWVDAIHTAHSYFTVLTPNASIEWASGQDYSVPSAAVTVPEPQTYAMLGVGLGLMGWVRRRRKVAA
jgi:hypothetical protein